MNLNSTQLEENNAIERMFDEKLNEIDYYHNQEEKHGENGLEEEDETFVELIAQENNTSSTNVDDVNSFTESFCSFAIGNLQMQEPTDIQPVSQFGTNDAEATLIEDADELDPLTVNDVVESLRRSEFDFHASKALESIRGDFNQAQIKGYCEFFYRAVKQVSIAEEK